LGGGGFFLRRMQVGEDKLFYQKSYESFPFMSTVKRRKWNFQGKGNDGDVTGKANLLKWRILLAHLIIYL
jgi:hypothetical protein